MSPTGSPSYPTPLHARKGGNQINLPHSWLFDLLGSSLTRRTFTVPGGTFIPAETKEMRMPTTRLVRSLSFPLAAVPAPLRWLLGEFRLLVNRSIRIALREDLRSRARLTKGAYPPPSPAH